ncbi:S-adenosyl-L-methionine-dependent methyltransferase [Daldinia caldariorum]|uniref:S-adenosyl-L-methionine-dependent methyltransferase n=1 Tax=Daldinia caldariorum TaxID=326644 RepID=UPI00200754BE|nr:S-adenosyl-L-methionine-dependent methyltransferase [Daldinia caldariorum]KAI1465765.1 S-adenosyl-L-methionine-dependent methyltransferase [Daldinia caldariorum]
MSNPSLDVLEELSKKLSEHIRELCTTNSDGIAIRREATGIARRLVDELIDPEEWAAEQTVALGECAAIRMFMKWGFFDKIPLGGSVSYRELAGLIGAQEALVFRLGQMLVSTGMLVSPMPNSVAHSRLSPLFKSGDREGCWFAMLWDDCQPGLAKLPEFFEKYGPREPVDKTLPLSFGLSGDGQLDPWELVAQRGTEHIEQFGHAMQAMPTYAWPYTGAYDFEWVAKYAVTNSERPLIVDVGGSYGHALRVHLTKFPGIPPSRCVVEDRAEMILNVKKEHENDTIMKYVTKVPTDFHKEQPVKGALVYLIRRCLHNYNDEVCVNILRILADSLPDDEPEARVLINEQIMTDPPHRFVASIDLTMLTMAARVRSEQQFEKLANQAGLILVTVHKQENTTMGVVECKKGSPMA